MILGKLYEYKVPSSNILSVITDVIEAILTKNIIDVIKKSTKNIGKNVFENCDNKYCFNFTK
jgi:hypothetical protein|tara:strand:+ start:76 stop:261 length:186 start_codon:yes stop_codon:yes gene_type:complete